jgi:hypothetical protein
MPTIFGIDTSGLASAPLNTQAASMIGGPPKFWGRYFNGVKPADDSCRYQYDSSENAVLHQLGIAVTVFRATDVGGKKPVRSASARPGKYEGRH